MYAQHVISNNYIIYSYENKSCTRLYLIYVDIKFCATHHTPPSSNLSSLGLLVLEHHAEHVPAEVLGQPPVLQHRHLQALAAEPRGEVGVDGAAHPLQHDQVHRLARHLLRQLEITGVSE